MSDNAIQKPGNTPVTIVCLHGGPGLDDSYFFPYLDAASSYTELFSYSQSGKTFQALVQELKNKLSSLGNAPLFLLGHSFGSFVVGGLLRDHKVANLKGVIFSNGITNFEFLKDYYQAFPEEVEADDELETDDDYRNNTLRLTHQYFAATHLEQGREVLSKVRYDVKAFLGVSGDAIEQDLTQVWQNRDFPLLMLSGNEDDVVQPSYNSRLIEALRPEQTHEFQGAGHFPFVEKTEEFHQVVGNFVKKFSA